ncbi:hypothetical protein LPJ53_002261 [Coemansia erecta]|uniref:Velvet domain-containing protein n=1 Tax=Coemansia erecta TaxID=147472 RepID=A0A9W7Y2K9_9FUNG|nr:hypothetical protein LPJ53_002261 [Coemansia erecta]
MTLSAEPEHTYRLSVIQQPKRAKAFGFGDRDRRPIDPCPIVQLRIVQPDGIENQQLLWEGTFVMHATLYDESGTTECSASKIIAPDTSSGNNSGSSSSSSSTNVHGLGDDQCYEQMALGSLASSAHHVRDLEDKRGCFFCFPDIRVRHPGRFRLRFTLIRLQTTGITRDEPISVLIHELSEPFTVYTTRDFPGVDESTTLSKRLNMQGVGIPIRNKGRLKQEEDDDDGGATSN